MGEWSVSQNCSIFPAESRGIGFRSDGLADDHTRQHNTSGTEPASPRSPPLTATPTCSLKHKIGLRTRSQKTLLSVKSAAYKAGRWGVGLRLGKIAERHTYARVACHSIAPKTRVPVLKRKLPRRGPKSSLREDFSWVPDHRFAFTALGVLVGEHASPPMRPESSSRTTTLARSFRDKFLCPSARHL